jgi:hypothetical protein
MDLSWALTQRVERMNINVQKNYNRSYLSLLNVPSPVDLVVLLHNRVPRLHPEKFENNDL